MIRIYTFFLLVLSMTDLTAQKHDNVWWFGYSSQEEDLRLGGSTLDFNVDTVAVYYEFRALNMDRTNASFCDAQGNLLLATNGIYIADAFGDSIENGEELTGGVNAINWSEYGYRITQGTMFLPSPIDSNVVYLFHLSKESPSFDFAHYSKYFYYTRIENIHDDPVVVEKNELILSDSLNIGKLTAVKHANGLDWWILLRELNRECYYTWLWKDETITLSKKQCFPEGENWSSSGQAVFSPDGSRFIYQNLYNDVEEDGSSVQVYDFDRCTGELSSRQSFAHIDGAWGVGLGVSPSSRFLYVSSYYYLYQYDLWADNIEATKDTIAEWDGWVDPEFSFLESTFNFLQLAPDNKIYMSTRGATNVMHRINQPNLPGDSCDFVQRAVQLPTYNAYSIPNFPNYRLGPLEGVECDPVSVSDEPVGLAQVMVYPNPASDELFIDFGNSFVQDKQLQLFDALGQLVRSYSLTQNRQELDVSQLPRGVYFLHIAQEGQANQVEKVILN